MSIPLATTCCQFKPWKNKLFPDQWNQMWKKSKCLPEDPFISFLLTFHRSYKVTKRCYRWHDMSQKPSSAWTNNISDVVEDYKWMKTLILYINWFFRRLYVNYRQMKVLRLCSDFLTNLWNIYMFYTLFK